MAVPNWLTSSSGCQNWTALLDAHLVAQNWRIGELFGGWNKNRTIPEMQAKDRGLSTTAVSRTLRTEHMGAGFRRALSTLRSQGTEMQTENSWIFQVFLPAECIEFLKNVSTWKNKNQNETLDRETDLCRVTAEPPLVTLRYCALSGLGDT